MIPRSYATHSQERAQDLAAAILSATSSPQILAAFSAVEDFLRGDHTNLARSFFSVAFPPLLCRLFGFDHTSISLAWIEHTDPDVSARVADLLSTRSILFSAISAVDRQSPVKFIFPSERLPEWMKFTLQSEKLCPSDLCPLFESRVSENALQLNVFEYFIFWFAYYPVCRGKNENSSALPAIKSRRFKLESWTSSWRETGLSRSKKGCGLYLKLLYEFLQKFVPKNNSFSGNQSHRSSLLHCSSTHDNSEILRAEFIIYTLVNFWMVGNDFSPLPQSLCSLPLQPLMAETPPVAGLTRYIQLLVTYLNSSLSGSNDLEEKIAGSWNFVIQRPLYRFILRSFLFCPIETSTENAVQVISLWVSYLQPWKTTLDHLLLEGVSEKDCQFSCEWKGYVTSNYLFYNSLFVHFLGFAHKLLHTSVEKMVHMAAEVLSAMTSSREMIMLLKDIDVASHSSPARDRHPIMQQLQDWEYGLCESDVDGSFLRENWNRELRLFSDDEDGAHWLLQLLILRAESEIQSLPRENLARSLRDLDAVKARTKVLFDAPVKRARCRPMSSSGMARAKVEGFSPKHSGGVDWAEVKYKGDWMRRPVSEGEVAWLADLLVNISNRVNRALGLDQTEPQDGRVIMGQTLIHCLRKRGARINLRPLASKKLVLLAVVIVLVALLRRLMGWA